MTPADWRQRWKDDADERAAIREFDGGQARKVARAEAEIDTRLAARKQQMESLA